MITISEGSFGKDITYSQEDKLTTYPTQISQFRNK